jgi:hypothetical protein
MTNGSCKIPIIKAIQLHLSILTYEFIQRHKILNLKSQFSLIDSVSKIVKSGTEGSKVLQHGVGLIKSEFEIY